MKRLAQLIQRLPLIASLTLLLCLPAWGDTQRPFTIVILHSYNLEYDWTAEIHAGLFDRLKTLVRPRLVCTEFLDWKRFPSEALIQNLASHLADKYAGIPVDVIIASDDKALEFAARYRQKLFSDAPIVFTGVYEEAVPALTAGQDRITGVYENQDVKTTIRHALSIQREARAAYIISDMNESGQAVEQKLREALNTIAPDLPVHSLSDNPIGVIEKIVSRFTTKDLLFIGSYSIDAEGTTYTGETLISRVATAARTPVYVLNTHHLGTGAIGGHLLSPYLLGSVAGKLAIRILDGEQPNRIEPVATGVYLPRFDWNAVKRFGIERLPPGSRLINREDPFFVRYRSQSIGVSLAFLVLLVFIYILYLNVRRAKRLAQDLAIRNGDLQTVTQELEKSEERYRLAAVGSNDAIWDWDVRTGVIHLSDRWFDMTGYPVAAQSNEGLEKIVHPDDKKHFIAARDRYLEAKEGFFREEIRIRCASGAWKWISVRGKAVWEQDRNKIRLAGSITDIDERKQTAAKVENLAYYDQLTSLPNRSMARVFTAQALEEEEETNALLFINLDDFKDLNDTWGHALGDKLLIRVAETLSSLVNERIRIARYGGDEFIILASGTNAAATDKFAQLVLRLLGRRMEIDGRTHYLSVSIGIAMYPDHGDSFDELIQKADAALHQAKKEGKKRYCFFDTRIQEELRHYVAIESALRNVVDNNELYTAYQPQVDILTGKIVGFEALARWNSFEHGEVSPGVFIPVAEATGQMDKIFSFILNSVFAFIKRGSNLGYDSFEVSINVSAIQLEDEEFVPRIIRTIAEQGIPPQRICLEITESLLISRMERTIQKLQSLRDAGIRLALDDFGQGFSSLSYLNQLPVHYLKIDKVFVDDILTGENTRILTQNIIILAHQLGLTVVAEGVEEQEQINYLRDHTCDIIQGYCYSKPELEERALAKLELSFNP